MVHYSGPWFNAPQGQVHKVCIACFTLGIILKMKGSAQGPKLSQGVISMEKKTNENLSCIFIHHPSEVSLQDGRHPLREGYKPTKQGHTPQEGDQDNVTKFIKNRIKRAISHK